MSDLSEDERRRVAAQVDYFIELVGKRYDVQPSEVLEAVRWVRERREFAGKLKSTGMMGVIGLMISSLAMALWEGLKTLLAGGPR